MTQNISSRSAEDKALKLLGSGVPIESVAAALGVEASRISQLMASPDFHAAVTELRYKNLQAHNKRDGKYDEIEDRLLDKLDKSIPFLLRPGEILKALQVVNSAKRRGQSSPDQVVASQNVVTVTLPTQIVQQFTTNINNQVTVAGGQSLETIQPDALASVVSSHTKSVESQTESQTESNTKNDATNNETQTNSLLSQL